MKTFTFVAVLALTLAVAASYPGCRTAWDCQKNGDMGAYCRSNGFCHCDQPFYNATTSGTCELSCCPTCNVKCCRTDAQCRTDGDELAYCRMVNKGGNGWCHCGTGFQGQFCSKPAAMDELVALATKATITDCGSASTHARFTTLSVVPNPPVKGSKAALSASGTVNEAVTSAKYAISVSLDGNQLYTHSGDGCGTSTISLPLGFGTIDINGPSCPVSAGAFSVGLGLTLPTAAPSGNYAVQFTGTDQNSQSLWCVDTKFTF